MKIISIANAKGGVAKTTTTLCLASYLASKGQRVLVMDIDSQANATTTLLRMQIGETTDQSTLPEAINSYLDSKDPDALLGSLVEISEGITLAPSSNQMERIQSSVESKMRNRLNLMPTLLQAVKDRFDFVLFDCSPDLSVYVESALYFSDLILMPSTYDVYSFDGVTQVIGTVREIFREIGIDFPGQFAVLYTMVNPAATRIQKALSEDVKKMEAAGLVLPFQIMAEENVKNCLAEAGDLMRDKSYKHSRARLRYQQLGEYILETLS